MARHVSVGDRVALADAVIHLLWVAVHTPGSAWNDVIADPAFLWLW